MTPDFDKDRADASAWAQTMLEQRCVILDSETTGLDGDAEIVQLSVINAQGVTLFDTLIQPSDPQLLLRPGKGGLCAAEIHGIYPEHLAEAPLFRDVYSELWKVLRDRPLVIYNRAYDTRVLKHCCALAGVQVPYTKTNTYCAMLTYAQFVGEWNDYRGDYRWQPLDGGDHSALGDCRATLKLLKRMAAAE